MRVIATGPATRLFLPTLAIPFCPFKGITALRGTTFSNCIFSIPGGGKLPYRKTSH